MDDVIIARALHLLAIVMWIGGVAFVTLVVMPSIHANHAPEERLTAFHKIEGRFAPQARFWVLLAGASGLWMIHRTLMWDRFTDPGFWWMHSMVVIWAVFALMLFVIEPLVGHRRLVTTDRPSNEFVKLLHMHRVALALAVITMLGAIAGSHGLI